LLTKSPAAPRGAREQRAHLRLHEVRANSVRAAMQFGACHNTGSAVEIVVARCLEVAAASPFGRDATRSWQLV